jgi:hypothetical protein
VLFLALDGLKLQWQSRRPLMAWFIVVMIIGVIAALGTNTPLYGLLYRLPGSTLFRVPARAWFLFSFAMAALAGFGIQGLIEWGGRPGPIVFVGDGEPASLRSYSVCWVDGPLGRSACGRWRSLRRWRCC